MFLSNSYWLPIAMLASFGIPSRAAYSPPMTPCRELNSLTKPVAKSAFAYNPARQANFLSTPTSSATCSVNASNRSARCRTVPSLAWKSTKCVRSKKISSDTFWSCSKKNRASLNRAPSTHSHPRRTVSSSPELRTNKNSFVNLPAASRTGNIRSCFAIAVTKTGSGNCKKSGSNEP